MDFLYEFIFFLQRKRKMPSPPTLDEDGSSRPGALSDQEEMVRQSDSESQVYLCVYFSTLCSTQVDGIMLS